MAVYSYTIVFQVVTQCSVVSGYKWNVSEDYAAFIFMVEVLLRYLSNTATVIVGFYRGTDNSIAILQEIEPLLIGH